MNNPLITIFCCYRVKKEANKKSIFKFLDTVQQFFPAEAVEVLLKIDSDDLIAINEILPQLNKYSFVIKPLIFNRWEGRWSMNYFYDYMFTQRNPNSKFIALAGDDMYYQRNIMQDLQQFQDDPYCILGYFRESMTAEKMNRITDYKSREWILQTNHNHYISSYPIISTKLIEILGNFGTQPNVDGFFGLLNIILYKKYNILLAHHLSPIEVRANILREDNYGITFNQQNLISASQYASDDYFFSLLEQQAKNVYLNIIADNLLSTYTIND